MLTRDSQDSDIMSNELRTKFGISSLVFPLLNIKPVKANITPETKNPIVGLIFTSHHAVKCFCQENYSDIYGKQTPVFCVGTKTAEVAKNFGFINISTSNGTVKDMENNIMKHVNPKSGQLIYLRGRNVSKDIAQVLRGKNYSIREILVYEAEETTHIDKKTKEYLKCGTITDVMLYSLRTSKIFAKLLKKYGIVDVPKLRAVVISENASSPLSELGMGEIVVSPEPNGDSMLRCLIRTDLYADYLRSGNSKI